MSIISEADLLRIATGELDSLEFKSSRIFTEGMKQGDINKSLDLLAKSVSAMANSGGGRIILGASDETEPGQMVIDGGVPWEFKGDTIKEWLTNVIPPLVDPELRSLNVYPVSRATEGSQIGEGRAVIVIDIPDSEDAPHQSARDKRYYLRTGAKSLPIGNRLVMDIANRRKHPEITIDFAINSHSKPVAFVAYFKNTGQVMAHYVLGRIVMPKEIGVSGSTIQNQDHKGESRQVICFICEKIPPGRSNVQSVKLLPRNLMDSALDDLLIEWDVSADDTPIKLGSTRFGDVHWPRLVR